MDAGSFAWANWLSSRCRPLFIRFWKPSIQFGHDVNHPKQVSRSEDNNMETSSYEVLKSSLPIQQAEARVSNDLLSKPLPDARTLF